MPLKDPLSAGAPILPQSTFDPVAFAKENYDEGVAKQNARKASFANDFKLSKRWETPKFLDVLKTKNAVGELGTQLYSEGYDLKDLSNDKNIKAASIYNQAYDLAASKADLYNNQHEVLTQAQKIVQSELAKPDTTLNIEETNKRMNELKNSPDVFKAQDLLDGWGPSGVLAFNQKPVDIMGEISSGFGDWVNEHATQGKPYTDKDGNLVTSKVNQIKESDVKSYLNNLYDSDPKFQQAVKEQRPKLDPLYERGQGAEGDKEWLYKKYGSTKVFKDVVTTVKDSSGSGDGNYNKNGYSDKTFDTPTTIVLDSKKVTDAQGKETTDYTYGTVTGTNTIALKPQNIQISVTKGAIDADTGKPIQLANNVTLNVRDVTSFPISKNRNIVGGMLKGGQFTGGKLITDDKLGNTTGYNKERYVEGVFDVGTGANKTQKKILIPYKNVESDLESVYHGLSNKVQEVDSNQDQTFTVNGTTYKIPKDKAESFMRSFPNAKKQ